MNKEELLAHAIKMYPVGTKFHPVNSQTGEIIIQYEYEVKNDEPKWSGDVLCANGNLYVKGVWASVISHPEGYIPPPKINNTFPIY